MSAVLHPDIERLAFLLGTWRGTGKGNYPTIEPFTYTETVVFEHFGKPFVAYTQRTKGADGGPLHAEAGYIRPVDDGTLELVIAQPSGLVETHTGTHQGQRLEFSSEYVGRTPSAKRVDQVGRLIEVSDGVMTNELRMAAVGLEYQWHLSATLEPVAD